QSRLTVWDRAGMGAAVISELEARQLVYVNRKIGRMSSIGHSKYAAAVEPRGHMKRVVGRVLRQMVRRDGGEADFLIGDRVLAAMLYGRLSRLIVGDRAGWVAAAISKPEARQLVYVRMRMGRLSAIGHSRCAAVVEPRGHMKQVIGRVLQRQVVPGDGDEVDLRICDCGMIHVWLEQESGVVAVTAQRLSERAAH